MLRIISPVNNFVFDTQTEIQKEFIKRINSCGTEDALKWLLTVKNDTECTYPEDLTFIWESDSGEKDCFDISETPDFKESKKYFTYDKKLTLDNLKTGCVYYFRVNGSDYQKITTKESFTRFIKIDGVLNVRDIGGYNIKQGLLYRGSALDAPNYITDEGIKTFSDELKIKTELELRSTNETDYSLPCIVDGVNRISIRYRPYMEVFEEEHKNGICKIMEIFADENNYPIYFHCFGGADRTGMLALYLRALAGESDDIIHTDYELTGLSTYAAGANEGADGFRSRNSSYYKEFLYELQKFAPNKSLTYCVENFLKHCGVSESTLNKIKSIIRR